MLAFCSGHSKIPSMGSFLNEKQRKELLGELKLERMRRYAERIKVILLLDDDEGTIGNYKKRYKKGGIEGLINDQYFGDPVQ